MKNLSNNELSELLNLIGDINTRIQDFSHVSDKLPKSLIKEIDKYANSLIKESEKRGF